MQKELNSFIEQTYRIHLFYITSGAIVNCGQTLPTAFVAAQMHRDVNRLDEDRKELLRKNKKELCDQINIKTGELLDVLKTKGVITKNDTKFIMVTIVCIISLLDPRSGRLLIALNIMRIKMILM